MNNEITKCPKCNSENVSFVAFRNDDVFYCKDCYYTPNEAFRLELEKHPIDVGITRNFEEWLNFVLDNEQGLLRLLNLAKQAGFPVSSDESCHFAYKEKYGLFGSTDVSLDSEIVKFADLLFEDFVTQWWVCRNGTRVTKPW